MLKQNQSLKLVVVLSLVVLIWAVSWWRGLETPVVRLGDHQIRIDPRNDLSNSPIPGLWGALTIDPSGIEKNVLFKLHASEVAAAVSGYQTSVKGIEQDLIVLVTWLNADELSYIRSGEHHREMWHKTGRFAERAVEWDDNLKLYRIIQGEEYRSWSNLVDIDPDRHELSLDQLRQHWVANCVILNENPSCKLRLVWDDLQAEFSVSEPNLQFREQLKTHVKNTFESWVVKG